MYALIGRVQIKQGHEEETAAMAQEHGPALVQGMTGSNGAYWARALDGDGELVQHSFWLFETETDARAAETVFSRRGGECRRRPLFSSVPTSVRSSLRCQARPVSQTERTTPRDSNDPSLAEVSGLMERRLDGDDLEAELSLRRLDERDLASAASDERLAERRLGRDPSRRGSASNEPTSSYSTEVAVFRSRRRTSSPRSTMSLPASGSATCIAASRCSSRAISPRAAPALRGRPGSRCSR